MYKPNFEITPHILNTLVEIEKLDGRIDRSVILPVHEVELRYRATVESVHSSTAIEGNPLNLRQVAATLDGKIPRLTRSQYAEMEVKNYQRALDFVSERERITQPVRLEDILRIHYLMMDGLMTEDKIGKLRRSMVYVENPSGEVMYTAAETDAVESEIEALLDWVNSGNEIHPLIKAAILHFQFVSIHPFADGNGRTTRALTTLYMGLVGYGFRGSLALDSYFAADRRAYYAALSAGGDTYEARRAADLTEWIEYFIDGVHSCAKILAAEIELVAGAVEMPEGLTKIARDQMDILDYVERFHEITATEADEIVPGGRRTAQRKLKELVELGYLEVVGEGRDTRYRKRGQ